jgi:hypothetical protein
MNGMSCPPLRPSPPPLRFLFVVSDGMELIVTNLTFRALPMDWGIDDSTRGHLISTSFLGFVVGGTLGGYFGDMVRVAHPSLRPSK